jgi:hypothetical protein
VIQAIALVIVATPLMLRLGAVGAAIGVGVAFVVGLGVTYFYVRRTLPALDLKEAFGIPILATLATLVVALPCSEYLDSFGLPVAVELFCKLGLSIGVYLAVTLLLRPVKTRDKFQYVLRLLRGDGGAGYTGA